MALLENWVKLEPGVPKRVHFSDYRIVPRTLTDPWTLRPVERRSLVLYVDREDGVAVSKTMSVLSEKLAGDLSGYLQEDRYKGFEFVVVKPGPGAVAPRLDRVLPYVP